MSATTSVKRMSSATMTIGIIVIAVIVSVTATAGVMHTMYAQQNQEIVPATVPSDTQDEQFLLTFFEGTNNIRKIDSNEHLRNIVEISTMVSDKAYDSMEVMITSDNIMREGKSVLTDASAGLQAVDTDQSGGTAYSTTNVQVENVDEPDYLKNDSKYVYIVSGNILQIIDAYPAESAEVVVKIALDIVQDNITDIFLNGDRLVIFYNELNNIDIIPQYEFWPRTTYIWNTHVLIVNISDRSDPQILHDYSIDGDFRDARMIGDYVYFVTNSAIDYDYPTLPVIREGATTIMEPNAFYFDNMERLSGFNTLTAIDIFSDTISSETFLMGYTGTFYVSSDSFYLAYTQDIPFGLYGSSSHDKFFNVIVPLLPEEAQDKINAVLEEKVDDDGNNNDDDSNGISSLRQWSTMAQIMQDAYNKMDGDSRDELFNKIDNAMIEYDKSRMQDSTRTIIHKISIEQDMIEYVAKGTVPGRLLNQFSMDQYEDRFRVATTTEHYTQYQGWIRANGVYVLDEQMGMVGELDQIAPDESIFSARFMGERLYLVTFQQVDPFFVIDLSNDTPRILGELKIPGFSNYLHPFDDDHIIGIGRDTKLSENGWVEQLGIKIALFNVVNVTSPKVSDDIIIGDRNTYSEALHNHKAFFFDGTRGIMAIPVTGNEGALDKDATSLRNDARWHGFYVLNLNAVDGFSIKGTIPHNDPGSGGADNRWYDMRDARSFYIDDVLYTASYDYLKMNSLDTLDKINSIKLVGTGKFVTVME